MLFPIIISFNTRKTIFEKLIIFWRVLTIVIITTIRRSLKLIFRTCRLVRVCFRGCPSRFYIYSTLKWSLTLVPAISKICNLRAFRYSVGAPIKGYSENRTCSSSRHEKTRIHKSTRIKPHKRYSEISTFGKESKDLRTF